MSNQKMFNTRILQEPMACIVSKQSYTRELDKSNAADSVKIKYFCLASVRLRKNKNQ